METTITYNLRENNTDSDTFYQNLGSFTDTVLKEADLLLMPYVTDYYNYIAQHQIEKLRSKEEYLLELIMTGIFWRNYIHKAEKTAHLSTEVIKRLYHIRKTHPFFKPTADKIRGYLAFELLNSQGNSLQETYTIENYLKLLEWLSATGEFNEEVIRLRQWTGFYQLNHNLEAIIRSTISFSNIFTQTGRAMLGNYTKGVNAFTAQAKKDYAHREDFFFATRLENEYFLNMFGAEIMNRQLKAEFEQTAGKAALLPTCMRTEPQDGCKATFDGKELVCARCNTNCNIGRIASTLNKQGVTPYLIPHSSDFSRFLVKWKDNRETGLIGVACVLNLLAGGYEMKRLNIASQCVFLDYCGCKKHWNKSGFATNLNSNQLQQIITNQEVITPEKIS